MIKRFLQIGQIVGTHGVRGEMRVDPWCDTPSFLKGFRQLYLDENGTTQLEVRACRPHGNVALLSVCGVDTVEQAASEIANIMKTELNRYVRSKDLVERLLAE